MKLLEKPEIRTYAGGVYCPICTHTVEAEVQTAGNWCASNLARSYALRRVARCRLRAPSSAGGINQVNPRLSSAGNV